MYAKNEKIKIKSKSVIFSEVFLYARMLTQDGYTHTIVNFLFRYQNIKKILRYFVIYNLFQLKKICWLLFQLDSEFNEYQSKIRFFNESVNLVHS